jgi:hypothetical protein
MAVPTPLSKKLREALGADAGEDLVTWLQEMRADHEEKLAAIHADFAEYRHEMAALIQASEARLVERIHGVDERIGRVEVRLADVKADLMKRSFVFWVGAVGAIAALAGVLRH